jgi:hypothetical protein
MSKDNANCSQKTNTCKPARCAVSLGVYLVAVLLIAGIIIGFHLPSETSTTWQPGESGKHQLLVDITAESLASLHQAQDAIASWRSQTPASLSTSDKTIIRNALNLATWLASAYQSNTVTSSVKISSKIQIITNSFSITNTTGPSGMTTAMKLNQEASKATVVTTNWTTNYVQYGTSSVLPLSGDLRLVPARQLQNANDLLDSAIKLLQSRAAFLQTNIFSRSWPSKYRRCYIFGKISGDELVESPASVPRLAPMENDEMQNAIRSGIPLQSGAGSQALSSNSLLLLFALGLFGGSIKCLASLVDYVGKGKFLVRWAAYYLLHPIIGGALAVAFVMVLKGGLSKDTGVDATNPYALYAIAVVVGMFSDEASKKLAKIAQAIFTDNTSGDSADSNDATIQHASVVGSPAFTASSVVDLGSLVAKLNNTPPAGAPAPTKNADIIDISTLSQYLKGQFTAATVELLGKYKSSPDPEVLQALVDGINQVIAGKPLYQAPLFAANVKSLSAVSLRKQLMVLNPPPEAGADMERLNWLLLAEAYSDVLTAWQITLQGTNYTQKAILLIDGKPLPSQVKPVIINTTTMTVAIKLTDLEPGTHSLLVSNTYPACGIASVATLVLA